MKEENCSKLQGLSFMTPHHGMGEIFHALLLRGQSETKILRQAKDISKWGNGRTVK